MTGGDRVLLSPDVGSASLKAAVRDPALRLHVDIAGSDGPDARLSVTVPGGPPRAERCPGGWPGALDEVAGALERHGLRPTAVAHRIVHGSPALDSARVADDALLERLGAEADRDPLHLPRQLQVVADARAHWPRCAEVLVPDGGCHRDLPDEAVTLPLPAEDRAAGLRRWGFHGLAVQSVVDLVGAPGSTEAPAAADRSGSSVTGVRRGRVHACAG
ncbi:hypothetical protein [Blastococcus sp. VKM Ac-2987]|uniref:hypothetical protein n=1 Tax=Blastococcus sp. VKM Ac-2987 TaxID=3004141 RepID=UPI0022ABA79E|nr:hypothetical protein [Blastococcus sp. VKM Ac-2987]MCZ2860507.1 hypothetical protein [Blastococcus sp. VKM Ac-2987]